MTITKELLEDRITEIENQKAQFVANANACGGAITALYQVIADLEKEDAVDEEGQKDQGRDDEAVRQEEG